MAGLCWPRWDNHGGTQLCVGLGRGAWMDPVMLGAVLLAVVGGASGELGARLWDGVVRLVRRPFRLDGAGSPAATGAVPAGGAELAALQNAPGDEQRAVALARMLLQRADADDEFGRALASWWEQAAPVRTGLPGDWPPARRGRGDGQPRERPAGGALVCLTRACQIFCVSWGSRCPFVMLVGSFSVPGQTGTRSPNATANAFMAAFQP